MHQQILLHSGMALCLVLVSLSSGAELRTYSFVAKPPAYNFSCGECSGLPYWVRGEVEGTFEVSLDFENGVGTLHSLNVLLSNVEGNFGPDIWRPVEWPYEFLESSSHYDRYRPPYTGRLMPAVHRPLGPASRTAEHWMPYVGMSGSQIPVEIDYWLSQGVGFEPAPANSWILYFDGFIRNPDGRTVSVGSSFLIYFEGNRAQFSYYVPIIDAVPSIAAASAVLIPEPSGLLLGSFMLCWLCTGRRRNGLTKRSIHLL